MQKRKVRHIFFLGACLLAGSAAFLWAVPLAPVPPVAAASTGQGGPPSAGGPLSPGFKPSPSSPLGGAIFFDNQSAQPMVMEPGFGRLPLNPGVDYLVEPVGASWTPADLSLAVQNGQAAWRRAQSTINLGIIDQAVWARFRLRNAHQKPQALYLQSTDTVTHHLDIYWQAKALTAPKQKNKQKPKKSKPNTLKGGQWQHLEQGTHLPFAQRLFPHHSFIVPVELGPQSERTYLVRFGTPNPMVIDLIAWESTALYDSLRVEGVYIWLYFGFMLVMLAYNGFIYVTVLARSYLYYLLYLAAFMWVAMSMTGLGNQYLWPSFPEVANYMMPISMFAMGLGLYFFITEFLDPDTRRPQYVEPFQYLLIGAGIVTVVHTIFIQSALWNNIFVYSLLPPAAYGYGLIAWHWFAKRNRQALYLLVAMSLLLAGFIIISLRNLTLVPHNGFTAHAYFFGSAAEMVLLSLGLADRINAMKAGIAHADSKYRHLIEDADEVIFTLDNTSRFLTANKAARRLLGYKPDELTGRYFFELISGLNNAQTLANRRMVLRAIADLELKGIQAQLVIPMKKKFGIEPALLNVKLDRADFLSEGQLLGKATPVGEDLAVQFLKSETHTYSIENFLSSADVVSHRITLGLGKYCEPNDVHALRVGLREMLINAIEHGNLGVTYQDKTEHLTKGTYIDFIQERQKQQPWAGRRVRIEYSLGPEYVVYRITDEGDGFNVDQPRPRDSGDVDLHEHGRGIAMTRQIYDKVEYNAKGNEVTLTKYFKSPT